MAGGGESKADQSLVITDSENQFFLFCDYIILSKSVHVFFQKSILVIFWKAKMVTSNENEVLVKFLVTVKCHCL